MKQKVAISIISLAFIFYSCKNEKNESAENKFPTEAIPVKIAPVQNSSSTLPITASGLIATENEARYSFKIGGVIERIGVQEGQFFKKGQLLASLKINEIDAQLSQANLAYEKAKREYSRTSNLYKDSVATLEQLQNAKTGLDIAQKSVDLVAFNKKYAQIYAQADGFVTKKIANDGEVVSAGIPVLAINETKGSDNWILKLGLSDKEWTAISVGNKASVTIDALPGKILPGVVTRKSHAADQGSGSFQVEIRLMLGDIKPAAGMFGKASIETGIQSGLPGIPYDAVVEADGNRGFVYVPDGSDRVKRIPITIESFNDRQVIVKSGLENIPAVIVSNSAFLNEKSIITIVK